MTYVGMYGEDKPDSSTYHGYIESLATLVKWLLDRDYDVRLLIGQLGDPVSEFKRLLDERLTGYDSSRILNDPVTSVGELLSQFADTDFVVATRFHNVLFALLHSKPTVSISFHHKCASLMNAMGLSRYCIRIDRLRTDDLIEKVLEMEKNSDKLKSLIAARNEEFRRILEEQYQSIFLELTKSLSPQITDKKRTSPELVR